MSYDTVRSLARLVHGEREAILAEWRRQVEQLPGARDLGRLAVEDHIPDLIDELALALREEDDESILEAHLAVTPSEHGRQRVADGFDITEVVAEYNVLRGCIHDLADRHETPLRGPAFHIVNRVLDGAIATAVRTFAEAKALEIQRRREEHLAFVAHDLRTPLSAIGLAGTLLEAEFRHASTEDSAAMFGTLRRNVERLNALVIKVVQEQSNLHADSTVRVQAREFDLWPLVENLLLDIGPLARASSTELVNHVPRDFVLWADAHLLTQILQNLVSNAIEYAPQGRVQVKARPLSGEVELSVQDDGKGIPPDRIGRVFVKLEKDPEKSSGLGLGLSIVKQFAEAHGGHVEVESRLGAGSTFRVVLPQPGPSGPDVS